MIGHYLQTLCPAAEDAILTGKMEPGSYGNLTTRCLVGWAADTTDRGDLEGAYGRKRHFNTQWRLYGTPVEGWYDDLCKRFGTERSNAAIRNRILANKARRELAKQRHEVVAP